MRHVLLAACLVLALAPSPRALAQSAAPDGGQAADPAADAALARKAMEVAGLLQGHLAASTSPRDDAQRWDA
jgi:hypothetical protein